MENASYLLRRVARALEATLRDGGPGVTVGKSQMNATTGAGTIDVLVGDRAFCISITPVGAFRPGEVAAPPTGPQPIVLNAVETIREEMSGAGKLSINAVLFGAIADALETIARRQGETR